MPVIKDSLWHAARAKTIGGSDAAAVLGISPFKTALRLWKEKKGEVTPEDVDSKEIVYWGTVLESIIIREYENRTGYSVEAMPDSIISTLYPWMACNLDFRVTNAGIRLIGECKNVGLHHFSKAEWGDEGSNQIPPYYYAQCQHNMIVDDAQQCDFPCLIGGSQFRLYQIPRDEKFCDALIEAEAKFMASLVDGVEPEPVNLSDCRLAFPFGDPEVAVEASEQDAEDWALLCQWQKTAKTAKGHIDTLKLRLQKRMGVATALHFNGAKLVRWINTRGGGRRFYTIGVDDE